MTTIGSNNTSQHNVTDSEAIEITLATTPVMGRYCMLCGESFCTSVDSGEQICPECKEAWAKLKQKVLHQGG